MRAAPAAMHTAAEGKHWWDVRGEQMHPYTRHLSHLRPCLKSLVNSKRRNVATKATRKPEMSNAINHSSSVRIISNIINFDFFLEC